MPDLNPGDVNVVIAGETRVLRRTLRAGKIINSAWGGYAEALKHIQGADQDAILLIVAAGLDKRTPADMKVLEQEIFDTGITEIVESASKFLVMLANGGKSTDAVESEDEPKN